MNKQLTIIKNKDEIISLIQIKKIKVLGIDGNDGVGKTTLASEIAEKLGLTHIEVDKYLVKDSNGYLKFLDLEKLKADINKNAGKKIIIEGVMLYAVLEQIDFKVDEVIYVAKNPFLYDWLDEYSGKFVGLSFDEIIKLEEESVNLVNNIINPNSKPYKMDGFRLEVYEYSYKFRPWEKADIIFET